MAIFKFHLKYLRLQLCGDGNKRIKKDYYPGVSIYLDKSVYEFLENCKILISNNNFILIIENENEKHWRISQPTKGDLWNCIVGRKIITRNEEEKIKILCTEADINFKISRVPE